MVFIICGGINRGKTNKLKSIYDRMKKGDGFLSVKRFSDGVFLGYDIVQLSTQKSVPLIRRKNDTPPDWIEEFQFDQYSFSAKGIAFANELINRLTKNNTGPVFIDEIGQIELTGKGFDKMFGELLKSNCDIYVAIRDVFLDKIVLKYGITDYKTIPLR